MTSRRSRRKGKSEQLIAESAAFNVVAFSSCALRLVAWSLNGSKKVLH